VHGFALLSSGVDDTMVFSKINEGEPVESQVASVNEADIFVSTIFV
jgi:hypothetical protein